MREIHRSIFAILVASLEVTQQVVISEDVMKTQESWNFVQEFMNIEVSQPRDLDGSLVRLIGLNKSVDRTDALFPVSKVLFEMYVERVKELPGRFEEARDSISSEIRGRNRLGYSFVAGRIVSALLEIISGIFIAERSLLLLPFNPFTYLISIFIISGHISNSWSLLFPDVFAGGDSGGDPFLACTSENLKKALEEINYVLFPVSYVKPRGEAVVLVERLRVKLREETSCVIKHVAAYQDAKEIEVLIDDLRDILLLIHQLTSGRNGPTMKSSKSDIILLDNELEIIWSQIEALVIQSRGQVYLKTANLYGISVMGWALIPAVRLFTGLLMGIGSKLDLGFVSLYDILATIFTFIQNLFVAGQLSNPLGLSQFLSVLGITVSNLSSIITTLLFVSDPEPPCGVETMSSVLARYDELRNFNSLLTGGKSSKPVVSSMVYSWNREILTALHCVAFQTDGAVLKDIIDLWTTLALHRIKLA